MAENPLCNTFNCPVIHRFIENIEKLISSNPAVLSSNIQKHFGPDNETVYLKGSILFMDSSALDIAILAKQADKTVSIDKYRFHYMDRHEKLLFRYDNAPHHSELPSFPDHKHIANQVIPTLPPNLKDILNEINAMILKE